MCFFLCSLVRQVITASLGQHCNEAAHPRRKIGSPLFPSSTFYRKTWWEADLTNPNYYMFLEIFLKASKQPPSSISHQYWGPQSSSGFSRLHWDLHNKSSYLTVHLENLVFLLPSPYFTFLHGCSLSLSRYHPHSSFEACETPTILFYTCQN